MKDYTCQKCNGTGIWPDGATFEQAKANPMGQHAIEFAKENNQILLTPQAVSPLSYNADGTPKCLYCHGKGHNKPPEPVKPKYPEKQSIHVTEAAKMIRVLLKRHFPGQKFYVNSDDYSGGCSIDVSWQDGPTESEVNAVIGAIEGKGFDGMIDMEYYTRSWLMPDGEVSYGGTPGTEGSRGTVSADEVEKPHPDAVMVQFYHYLFLKRVYSQAFVEEVTSRVAKEYHWDMPKLYEGSWYTGKKRRGENYEIHWEEADERSREYSKALKETSAYAKPEADNKPPQADNKTPSTGNLENFKPTESGKIEVRYDRDWTWLGLPSAPPEAVEKAIRGMGFYFSSKRGKWFAKERLEVRAVVSAIAAAV